MAAGSENSAARASMPRIVGQHNVENCEIVDASEIRDLLEYNPPRPFTTSAILNYCQRKMILPYSRLLGLLGLRPLLGDFSEQNMALNAINKIHLLLVTCFLIFGHVMQLLTCYRRDQGFSYTVSQGIDYMKQTTQATNGSSTQIVECRGSLFLCYILPSILHLCAFMHTIYLLRMTENEHLQTLFEKVFLLTSRSRGPLTQRILLRRLRAHLILSVIWLVWSLITQLYLVFATSYRVASFIPTMGFVTQQTLFGIMIASTFCQDVVHCLVVSNYCIECQLLISYVLCISEQVIEKSLALDVAMKEMLQYNKFVDYLNSDVSPAISIFLVISSVRTVVGTWMTIQSGFSSDNVDNVHSFAVVMLLVQWALISTVPFISASWVTGSGQQLRKLGQSVRARPFGFQETPLPILDSFLVFTTSQKGGARLCFIPISASFLAALVILAAVIFLVKAHL